MPGQTLESARDEYLRDAKSRGFSTGSLSSYQRHIDRMITFLSTKRKRKSVTDIKPADLDAYLATLPKAGFATATQTTIRATVSKWIRWMANNGKLNQKLFKPSSGRPRKWSDETIIATLKKLHKKGVRMTQKGLRDAGENSLSVAIQTHMGGMKKARALAKIPEPKRE